MKFRGEGSTDGWEKVGSIEKQAHQAAAKNAGWFGSSIKKTFEIMPDILQPSVK